MPQRLNYAIAWLAPITEVRAPKQLNIVNKILYKTKAFSKYSKSTVLGGLQDCGK